MPKIIICKLFKLKVHFKYSTATYMCVSMSKKWSMSWRRKNKRNPWMKLCHSEQCNKIHGIANVSLHKYICMLILVRHNPISHHNGFKTKVNVWNWIKWTQSNRTVSFISRRNVNHWKDKDFLHKTVQENENDESKVTRNPMKCKEKH